MPEILRVPALRIPTWRKVLAPTCQELSSSSPHAHLLFTVSLRSEICSHSNRQIPFTHFRLPLGRSGRQAIQHQPSRYFSWRDRAQFQENLTSGRAWDATAPADPARKYEGRGFWPRPCCAAVVLIPGTRTWGDIKELNHPKIVRSAGMKIAVTWGTEEGEVCKNRNTLATSGWIQCSSRSEPSDLVRIP